MQHIFILDYLLLPLYLAFFYWRVKKMAKKEENTGLRKPLLLAFWLRMVGAIAYSMLIEYYYGYGDSFKFFTGGNFFTDQISQHPSNFSYIFASFSKTSEWFDSMSTGISEATGYFDIPSNNMVMRISAVVSYLAFHKYLIIALFFAYFSFVGQWKLFLVFDDINKKRNRRLLAFAVLYSPSIWFWGSGLLKDSVCLGSVGIMLYIMYRFFVKKQFSIQSLMLFIFLAYIVSVIKLYITAILLAGLLIMFVPVLLKSIHNKVFRATVLLAMLFTVGLVIAFNDFSGQINIIAEESIAQIKEYQQSYQAVQEADETSKAGFNLGEIDPSPMSLLMKSPEVIFSCLFRPFLWESKKVIILFTSLESTLLLFFTLAIMFKWRFIHFFRIIFTTPHLLFCFSISMMFALVIGFTTFNFGTMIRYKIIFLPFYYFMLVNLYSRWRSSRKNIVMEPRVPVVPAGA